MLVMGSNEMLIMTQGDRDLFSMSYGIETMAGTAKFRLTNDGAWPCARQVEESEQQPCMGYTVVNIM